MSDLFRQTLVLQESGMRTATSQTKPDLGIDMLVLVLGVVLIILGVVASHWTNESNPNYGWMAAAAFWGIGLSFVVPNIIKFYKRSLGLNKETKKAASYKRQKKQLAFDLKEKTDQYDALSTKHTRVITAVQRVSDEYVNRVGQNIADSPDQENQFYSDPVRALDKIGQQINDMRHSLQSKRAESYHLARVMVEQVAMTLQIATFLLDVKKMIRQYDQLDARRAKVVQQVVALVGAWDDSHFTLDGQPMMSFDLVELFQANTRPDVVESAIRSMVDSGSLPADSAVPRSWEIQLVNFGTHELVVLNNATLAFESRFRHQIKGMKKQTSGRINPPELNSYEWHSAILGLDGLLMELASDQEQLVISVGRRMNGIWLLNPVTKNLIHLDQELIDKGYLREQVHDHVNQICLTLFELCRTNARVLPRFYLGGQDQDVVYLRELDDQRLPRVGDCSGASYDLARIWEEQEK
jgi:hypothetical protein